MPTPLMKSFAKQSGKKSKTVEKLWKKCEKIVKKEYDVDEDSKRFYPLVVGCLKNLLDLKKEDEKIEKDDPGITTTTMGAYVYPQKMSGVLRRGDPEETINSAYKKDKKYNKILKSISSKVEESESDMDDIISEMINFYSEKYEDSEKIVECAINATAKYLKLEDSLVNNLK